MREQTSRFGIYLSDLNRDKNDSHGIINYAVGLANALPGALGPDEEVFIYANPAISRELDAHDSARVVIRQTPPPTPTQRLIADHFLGLRRGERDELAVLHFPKGFLPALPRRRMRLVATLHDDIPLMYARGDFGREYVTVKSRYFTFALRHTLRRADGLVTVSDTSLGRFMDLAKRTGIPMPPAFVSHQGITLPLGAPVAVEDKKPILLHIGSTKPHKRSHEAVEFMLRFAAEHQHEFRLTILGPLRRETELLLQNTSANRIKRTLSGHELARIIRQSRVLVFNSEREGFGLPPVEAFALGTPAVFARTDVMVEVLGATPGAYTPRDYASFAGAMDRALALDSARLRELREGLLAQYDWAAVARETLKAYRRVAAER